MLADRLGEHGVDVLFRALQLPGNLHRGHAGAGQGDELVTHIGHHLRRLDLAAEHFEESIAVALQLARTDAADPGHFRQRSWLAAKHFQKCRIREDDIRRHAVFFGQFASQRTQGFPLLALFAAHQLAGLALAAALGGDLWFEIAAQFQCHFALEQWPAGVFQTQAAITFVVDIGQSTRNQLTEQRAPFTFAQCLANAEHRQMLMTETANLFVVLAQQHIDQMADAVTLTGAKDRRQPLTRRLGGVPGLHTVDAVVAMAARFGHLLIEIRQQRLTTATSLFAERQHRVELVLLQTLVTLVAFRVLQHLLEHHHVLQTVGHPRIRRQTVTTTASGFLVIRFEGFRQIEVGNKTHVGLVDAHAERHRGDHDQAFLVEETLLVEGA